jgi:hypothetical protein
MAYSARYVEIAAALDRETEALVAALSAATARAVQLALHPVRGALNAAVSTNDPDALRRVLLARLRASPASCVDEYGGDGAGAEQLLHCALDAGAFAVARTLSERVVEGMAELRQLMDGELAVAPAPWAAPPSPIDAALATPATPAATPTASEDRLRAERVARKRLRDDEPDAATPSHADALDVVARLADEARAAAPPPAPFTTQHLVSWARATEEALAGVTLPRAAPSGAAADDAARVLFAARTVARCAVVWGAQREVPQRPQLQPYDPEHCEKQRISVWCRNDPSWMLAPFNAPFNAPVDAAAPGRGLQLGRALAAALDAALNRERGVDPVTQHVLALGLALDAWASFRLLRRSSAPDAAVAVPGLLRLPHAMPARVALHVALPLDEVAAAATRTNFTATVSAVSELAAACAADAERGVEPPAATLRALPDAIDDACRAMRDKRWLAMTHAFTPRARSAVNAGLPRPAAAASRASASPPRDPRRRRRAN